MKQEITKNSISITVGITVCMLIVLFYEATMWMFFNIKNIILKISGWETREKIIKKMYENYLKGKYISYGAKPQRIISEWAEKLTMHFETVPPKKELPIHMLDPHNYGVLIKSLNDRHKYWSSVVMDCKNR